MRLRIRDPGNTHAEAPHGYPWGYLKKKWYPSWDTTKLGLMSPPDSSRVPPEYPRRTPGVPLGYQGESPGYPCRSPGYFHPRAPPGVPNTSLGVRDIPEIPIAYPGARGVVRGVPPGARQWYHPGSPLYSWSSTPGVSLGQPRRARGEPTVYPRGTSRGTPCTLVPLALPELPVPEGNARGTPQIPLVALGHPRGTPANPWVSRGTLPRGHPTNTPGVALGHPRGTQPAGIPGYAPPAHCRSTPGDTPGVPRGT